jgi:SAM-dependent methyltransferase
MSTAAIVTRKRPLHRSLWDRLTRFSFTHGRRTRKALFEFCRAWATDEYTLIVHSVDLKHARLFPNAFVVSKRRSTTANLYTDPYYDDLRLIGSGSFRMVVCTGLLEHLPDPSRVIAELHRILEPGGRLIVSASAVFPFHGSPDNYFHFTPNGFRLLFREWSGFEALRGSTRPFETIGVLLQRINIQCDIFPPVRPFIELLQHTVPLLDAFVIRQYDSNARRDASAETAAFMPATLHAVVVK